MAKKLSSLLSKTMTLMGQSNFTAVMKSFIDMPKPPSPADDAAAAGQVDLAREPDLANI